MRTRIILYSCMRAIKKTYALKAKESVRLICGARFLVKKTITAAKNNTRIADLQVQSPPGALHLYFFPKSTEHEVYI